MGHIIAETTISRILYSAPRNQTDQGNLNSTPGDAAVNFFGHTLVAFAASLALFASEDFAYANEIRLTPVARGQNGKVLSVNYYQAEKYCLERGLGLPSALDLSYFSKQQGAVGPKSTAFPGVSANDERVHQERHSMKNAGFDTLFAETAPFYPVVYFYHNRRGFMPGPITDENYWTASRFTAMKAGKPIDVAYAMIGREGWFYSFEKNESYDTLGVRCLESVPQRQVRR